MKKQSPVQVLMNRNAASVIEKLDNSFDSHDFIAGLIKMDEKGYENILKSFENLKTGIFRSFHAQIGRYLSLKSTNLGIRPMGKVKSRNIKGYESVNEEWQKVIPDVVQNDRKGN